MYINDVLRYCREHGKPMSRVGIYDAGKKNGFIFKVEGQYQYVFDTEKFLKWFKSSFEEIPEGYISVKELKTKYGISMNRAYTIANNPKAMMRRIGSGKGIMYVNEREAEKLIAEYRNSRSYNWEV